MNFNFYREYKKIAVYQISVGLCACSTCKDTLGGAVTLGYEFTDKKSQTTEGDSEKT